jgi:hypothetical protein
MPCSAGHNWAMLESGLQCGASRFLSRIDSDLDMHGQVQDQSDESDMDG